MTKVSVIGSLYNVNKLRVEIPVPKHFNVLGKRSPLYTSQCEALVKSESVASKKKTLNPGSAQINPIPYVSDTSIDFPSTPFGNFHSYDQFNEEIVE